MSVPRRKFRNKEEREAIRDEIIAKGADYENEPGYHIFLKIVEEFVASTAGKIFEGAIPMPTHGRNIEYFLPGRRIMKQCVRLVKQKPQ